MDKYINSCFWDFDYQSDDNPYCLRPCPPTPMVMENIHNATDMINKYFSYQNYYTSNPFLKYYKTREYFRKPQGDVPLLLEDGRKYYGGGYYIFSINIGKSLNLALSVEYINGILSLLMPD